MKQIAALTFLTLGSCASESRTSIAPAVSLSEKDLAELCSKLDEQAARRAGFTATYQGECDGSEKQLRFTYLAPDRARMEGIDGTTKTICWVIGDRTTIHVDDENRSGYAIVQCKSLIEAWAGFRSALDAAFPTRATTQDHRAELSPGPAFDLLARADPSSSEHGWFAPSVMLVESRHWFLVWLCRTSKWKHVQLEGSHICADDPNGAHFLISAKSGLIEEVRLGKRAHVELVEFLDRADESEFVIPDPKPGATDASENYAMSGAAAWFQTARNNAVGRIEGAARSEPPDAPAFRERVTRLFDLLHRTYARTRFAAAQSKFKTWIEDVSSYSAASIRGASTNPSARESAEHDLAKRRSDLEAALGKWATAATDGITAMELAEGDPARLASIAKSENEMIAQAVRSEFVEPLLHRFDDALKLARDQR